jgi:hypothetical protein
MRLGKIVAAWRLWSLPFVRRGWTVRSAARGAKPTEMHQARIGRLVEVGFFFPPAAKPDTVARSSFLPPIDFG